jgi:hypothetical protein
MIKGIIKYILYPAIIAAAYWVTDATLHEGVIPSIKAWIIIKSIALLLIPIAVFFAITKKENLKPGEIIIMGICSPVLICVLSILYIPVINAIQGKATGMSLREFGIFLLWSPVMAIEVSTYSGGLLGLVLAAIGLPITAIIIAKKKERSNNRLDSRPGDSWFCSSKR